MLVNKLSVVCAIAVLVGGARSAPGATWYVAPGGSGSGMSPGSPLGNVNAAFSLANQGDEIQLAGGTYGSQTIFNKSATSSWTQNVRVGPAPGASVAFNGQLDVRAAHLTLSGFQTNSRIHLQSTADFARVENIQTSSWIQVRSSYLAIVNNHFANGFGTDAIQIGSDGQQRSRSILIEGNCIHDYFNDTTDPNDTVHEDAIQLFDTQDVTIRNNQIFNVSNSSIIVSIGQGFGVHNVLVENNFLGRTITPSGSYGYGTLNLLQADSSNTQNFRVINNTIYADVHAANGPQLLLRNNIIDRIQSMGSTTARDHNLIRSRASGIGLGTGDVLGSLPAFVGASSGDFHIAGSNSVNLAFANELLAPTTDYDGQLRSTPLWVGADQPFVPILAGDYNDDGIVNAADYTVWRNQLGGSSLPNETASLGTVDQQDYAAWKSNFGSVGAGAGQGQLAAESVPEPQSLVVLMFAAILAFVGSTGTLR